MKVLVLGAGAREQALCYKLSSSKVVGQLVTWPGGPGVRAQGVPLLDCPRVAPWSQVVAAAKAQGVTWVMVGPEQPLAEGFADAALAIGLPVFGPVRAAAQLESSKAFSKDVMAAAGIPTAAYAVARDRAECAERAADLLVREGGVVLKASGLAAGKGVFVCRTKQQVDDGLERLYGSMKEAAATVVVESLMTGRECSFFTFLGQGMPSYIGFAVDYKRLQEGDLGPNTGGMGCYSPAPWLPRDAGTQIVNRVIAPLLKELARRGMTYTGCLYTGVMWTSEGPKVVEFNARMGDPECQALCMQDKRDWGALIAAKLGLGGYDGDFADPDFRGAGVAVGVVLASAGYPFGKDETPGYAVNADWLKHGIGGARVFGAAVKDTPAGLVTGSGRIVTVVADGKDFATARAKAYEGADVIAAQWPGAQLRRDIANGI